MPSARPLSHPRTIAVLRALHLGDLLCAVPAWRALRRAFPDAAILLIGLPWAKTFVERFPHYLDGCIEFPGYPGLPEQEPDFDRLTRFIRDLKARRIDWLLQMQGDGSYVNDLIRLCGARETAGFCRSVRDCPDPDRFMLYPTDCSEIHRHLRLMEFLGIPSQGDHLEWPLMDEDRTAFEALPEAAELAAGSFVCLHPGGRGAARRWPIERFAEVAEGLVQRGRRLVLTGTEDEKAPADELTGRLSVPPIDLVGKTSLGTLGCLLSRSRLLITNDTGVSHIAAALQIPSVVLSVGSDPIRWNPLDTDRHRVLAGRATSPADVLAQTDELLQRSPSLRPFSWAGVAARPLRVLTWHVHGNYLYALTHTPHRWYLPVGVNRPGYSGCAPGFPWPDHAQDLPVERLRRATFDCILFQSRSAYLEDQFEFLSSEQRRLPRLYVEHDPPDDPTDSRHVVHDPAVRLVHVTHFNRVMWDNGEVPTCVIEHGVPAPAGIRYSGELPRGLVVINDLPRRGRRVGADLVQRIRQTIPLDVIGMDSESAGGLGEISHDDLPRVMSRYRFLFHPVRYTSFGLAVCEAMHVGLPIVALAVTDMPNVLEQGISGYLEMDSDRLIQRMASLLADPDEARRLGDGARALAQRRFGLNRFTADWDRTLTEWVRWSHGDPPGVHGRRLNIHSSSSTGMTCTAKLR